MKRMLINSTQPEEIRVAMVDGQRLYDLDIENRTRVQKKASVYKGKITRVEPSLEAAFVDFGAERHGFLPLKEISKEYFYRNPPEGRGKMRIKDVVKEGTEVIVQVEKEERGTKGAALTTFISLAGRYMVLMPNNPRAGGISRRIEGEERDQLRASMNEMEIPKGVGVIVRTAGIGKSSEELQRDLDYLLTISNAIQSAAKSQPAPFLIFQESNIIVRAIRDYVRQDVGEILIDSAAAFNEAFQFVEMVIPHYAQKVKHYDDEIPLFNRYQVESQIETAFQREVKLPSGGSIVIDPTEAMVAIDINSARATKGSDIEDTALQTNLEAADEIARQLRLRDMGGLIVIDFIDMNHNRNQRQVENRMRDALEADRARVQVGKISRFGLLEMSRQRLRPSLDETISVICPRCNGQGTIRDTKSLALVILRLIQDESQKERSAEIRAIVPVEVGTYLLNEKRPAIRSIEKANNLRVMVIPNPSMETPHYEVVRLRDDDSTAGESSLDITAEMESDEATIEAKHEFHASPVAVVEPAVRQDQLPARAVTPAPQAAQAASPIQSDGLLKRVMGRLFGSKPAEQPTEQAPEQTATQQGDRQQRSTGGNQSSNRNRRNNRRRNQSQNRDRSRGEQRKGTHSDKREGSPEGANKDSGTQNKSRYERKPKDNTEQRRSNAKNRRSRPGEDPHHSNDQTTSKLEQKAAESLTEERNSEENSNNENRRRRRRGGRNRKRRENQDANDQKQQTNTSENTEAESAANQRSDNDANKQQRRTRNKHQANSSDNAASKTDINELTESEEQNESEQTPRRRPDNLKGGRTARGPRRRGGRRSEAAEASKNGLTGSLVTEETLATLAPSPEPETPQIEQSKEDTHSQDKPRAEKESSSAFKLEPLSRETIQNELSDEETVSASEETREKNARDEDSTKIETIVEREEAGSETSTHESIEEALVKRSYNTALEQETNLHSGDELSKQINHDLNISATAETEQSTTATQALEPISNEQDNQELSEATAETETTVETNVIAEAAEPAQSQPEVIPVDTPQTSTEQSESGTTERAGNDPRLNRATRKATIESVASEITFSEPLRSEAPTISEQTVRANNDPRNKRKVNEG